jgi:hypothetical protein
VRGRDDEAIEVRARLTVEDPPETRGAFGPGTASKGLGCNGSIGAWAQVEHLAVEHGEEFGRRAGLAEVAPVVGQHVGEDPPADASGNRLRVLRVSS